MLTIEYEQSLVETTVFLAVRNDERLECELHQVVDRLYEIQDEELRQREFVPVFRDFFTKLGFDLLIASLLAERTLIGELVDRCVVREAPRKKAQSAELLVQGNKGGDNCVGRTLVIQICPQSFLETGGTAAFYPLRGRFVTPCQGGMEGGRVITLMRRELLHVADMLDERFGYVRETFSGDPSQQNLQRDRYRVLWDIYVEGRLGRSEASLSAGACRREQFGVNGEKDRLERAFGRVFSNGTAGTEVDVFARIFDAPSLTHRNFMDWAREPALLFALSPDSNHAAATTACS